MNYPFTFMCLFFNHTNEDKVHAHTLLLINFSDTLICAAFYLLFSAKSLRSMNKNGHYIQTYALSFISFGEPKTKSCEILPAKISYRHFGIEFQARLTSKHGNSQ